MGCKGYCFLGLMHGRDTRLHQIPKRGRLNKGLCNNNEDVLFTIPLQLFLTTGRRQGYCFLLFGLGHSHDARSVNGTKAPLTMLEQFIMGMDAGPTIPNDGLP